MANLDTIPSQDPALGSFKEDVIESGHDDEIPNEERGCGHLESGKAYIRCDPQVWSPNGVLPIFVRCDPPIPYKEEHFRGFRRFPGVQFEAAVSGHNTTFVPLPNTSIQPDDYAADLRDNMATVYETDDDRFEDTDPVDRHLFRLQQDKPTERHMGVMREARAQDLLMWVGKTHYEHPQEFVKEARVQGLNKAIPLSSNKQPPVINPGRTRVWLLHMNAIPKESIIEDFGGDDEYVPGLIGYSYLSRIVYTRDDDGNVPGYVQEYGENGYLDVVDMGEEVSMDTESHSLHDFGDSDDDEDE